MGVMYIIASLKIAFIDEGLETPRSEQTFGSQIENGGCGVCVFATVEYASFIHNY